MTSRSYTKSYSRKVNSVTPGSIQFDKLFRENSNRPSAAKSAGTVGKWGITSFTSIRSTNINGRKDEIHKTFGTKRMKLDYGNQNAQVNTKNSNQDPFSFDTDLDPKSESSVTASVPTVPVVKPKKFFKSRNAPAVDESKVDLNRQLPVPDPQLQQQHHHHHPRARSQKVHTASKVQAKAYTPVRKISECMDSSSSDTSTRDDGKPPIVLRICKGTARLVSGDSKEVTECEPDTYRISPPSPTKQDLVRSSPETRDQRTSAKSLNIQQPSVTTVSIPLDEDVPTRRTTRSRAKNLNLDLTPPPAPASTGQNSGLSLTLRKSITDSNNTSISHYDIVKTDCPSYQNKPVVEPATGRHPLPTSTQELIDILSSEAAGDPSSSRLEPPVSPSLSVPTSAVDESEPQDLESITTDVQHCSIDLPPPAPPQPSEVQSDPESVSDNSHHTYYEEPTYNPTYNQTESTEAKQDHDHNEDRPVAKALVDQDWFSGSEDSEAASGNTETETQTSEPSSVSVEQTPMTAKPAVKKGSIFKSRSAGATNGNKRRALYKHKWCDNDKESIAPENTVANISTPSAASGSTSAGPGVDFDELEDSTLTRVVTYPEYDTEFGDDAEAITSVRCGKKVKGFYTVVKNVKKAHQIQESGEFQEFNDDVEYILDTLRENNPNATRCLSAIRLASKCMAPAFRMHVRAHGTVAKFFKALHDATKDQSLGLCTATVMFVLSQDRLAMDLDRDCLELMLSLLESDASHKDALDDCGLSRTELQKNKEKVRQLCADIQSQGHAKHLNLDNITVGQLAMETLLSLTSKRAGEWFKEELRELGGLEHIVKTITDCYRFIKASNVTRTGWSEPLLDKLRKVDRCLRVLENVTHMNEENQVYLLNYEMGILVSTMVSLYHLCGMEIVIYPTIDVSDKSSTGAVIRECIFAILKVLINLTHRFNRQSFGSKSVGSQSNVLDCSLNLLLRVPESLPEEKRFDMMILTLILLINLIEQCDDNKELLIKSRAPPCPENLFDHQEGGVDALIDLFYKQEEMARGEEQKTDDILDGKKDSEQSETVSAPAKTQEEFIAETVAKLLQKASRHMEHTMIGAHVVLLLGNLIMDNMEYETLVRGKLPDHNFSLMISILQKFYNFMNLTTSSEASNFGIHATDKVLKFLKLSDARIEEDKNALPLPALEESSIMLDLSSS
ncbi:protein wings apart-like [Microplitis mediator]|uniref:protein wings apart-like n=1 Tax=Microplitis mediator TaxID=375433 RepID=UPI00255459C2|nr:protein wings apart-like [Microplitis mediator]